MKGLFSHLKTFNTHANFPSNHLVKIFEDVFRELKINDCWKLSSLPKIELLEWRLSEIVIGDNYFGIVR